MTLLLKIISKTTVDYFVMDYSGTLAKLWRTSLFYPAGTQNYSGLSVFTVSPAEGSIAAGQCQDVTVTFQPDHQSVNYCDRLTVELSNKVSETQHTLLQFPGSLSKAFIPPSCFFSTSVTHTEQSVRDGSERSGFLTVFVSAWGGLTKDTSRVPSPPNHHLVSSAIRY